MAARCDFPLSVSIAGCRDAPRFRKCSEGEEGEGRGGGERRGEREGEKREGRERIF